MAKAPSAQAVEVVSRDTGYQGYLRVERLRLRHARFDGDWTPELAREVLVRGEAAAVLPYDPVLDRVLLVEQFRAPAFVTGHPGWMLEIVAGLLDAGDETAEQVARREADEEAAIAIGPLHRIARVMPSPGATAEWVTIFCGLFDAGGAGGLHGKPEEHEDIRAFTLPAAEAIDLVGQGRIENAFTVIALQWLALNRRRLRRHAAGAAR